jgi:opine dehydrogenase
MKKNRVAVLGSGPGAQATAGDLALMGHLVNMYDLPQFADGLKRTKETGQIELTGAIRGIAKINLITANIEEALQDVNIIFVVARSNADVLFAESCAPYLQDGQVVMLGAGNCGALAFANVLKEKKISKEVVIAESTSLPYGCRFCEPTRVGGPVHVRVYFTAPLAVGVFPASRTDDVIAHIKELYSETVAMNNVIEAGMQNPNPIVHCAPTLLNIGRIERVDDFKLFHEGFSESVIKAVLAISKEREEVCKALGWKTLNLTPQTTANFLDWAFSGTEPREGVEELWLLKQPMEDISKARYITEDVPYGMVTYSSLGNMIGVKTRTIDSIIQLASVINRIDYMAVGRTVETLGLSGLDAKQVNDFLYYGA